MAKNTIFRCLLAGLAIIVYSTAASASNHNPLPYMHWNPSGIGAVITDSVPAAKSQPENKDNNQVKNDETIKEVPKSRKQEKPMPVATAVIKPVIVKPKIIVKPIIKVH